MLLSKRSMSFDFETSFNLEKFNTNNIFFKVLPGSEITIVSRIGFYIFEKQYDTLLKCILKCLRGNCLWSRIGMFIFTGFLFLVCAEIYRKI